MNISYNEINEDQIDLIKPLWEKLRDHHHKLSLHFPERYNEFSFKKRKEKLLKKSENGLLRLDMVWDKDKEHYIGYCISSISNESLVEIDSRMSGEVDSIFLEEEYRSSGIGDSLMKRALHWMDKKGVETKRVVVAIGNEDLLSFYEQYDFFPRHLILEQK